MAWAAAAGTRSELAAARWAHPRPRPPPPQVLQDDAAARAAAKQAAAAKKAACREMLEKQMADNTYRRCAAGCRTALLIAWGRGPAGPTGGTDRLPRRPCPQRPPADDAGFAAAGSWRP